MSLRTSALKGEKRPVKIFDVEEKDPSRKLLKHCESLTDAEVFTGVSRYHIPRYIERKSRCYTNRLGKTLAFR